ncbi:MAG: hypothetical protein HY693_00655, partial [Deltaproteobacteria bacterium]|nr:hypothetical protein [Deltaproteobacteria bacterium]
MEIIIFFAILIFLVLFISLPFFKRHANEESSTEVEPNPIENPFLIELKRLNSEKESLYTALNDIEFDYGLGKLSREDYEDIKREYKMKAASILKEIDEISNRINVTDPGDEIEKEIEAIRHLKSLKKNEIEKEILKARKRKTDRTEGLFCWKCGKGCGKEDLYCSSCGTR